MHLFHKWPRHWRILSRYNDVSFGRPGIPMTELVKYCEVCLLPKVKHVEGKHYARSERKHG